MNAYKALGIARDLMKWHGLEDWSLSYDRAVRRFGVCRRADRHIGLSMKLVELNGEDAVIDTILHEIAHALSPAHVGHGYQWRVIARSIGCDGRRCYESGVITPPRKYLGTCLAGHTVERHKRRVGASCSRCSPVFDNRYLFTWTVK